MKKIHKFYAIPYYFWLLLFVILPVLLIIYQSFFTMGKAFGFENYKNYFTQITYLKMTANSVLYAFLITFFTLIISYPMAYLLTKLKHKQLWLMLIILPTWVNLLLKAYAFIGIFGKFGAVNHFLGLFGVLPQQILFTDFSFLFVATYIELPFMILPIFNALEEMNPTLISASNDLGANAVETFRRVIFPLSLPGVRSGVQAVFIPSLSLFMLTRLIGGNRVITLGTAIEEHFLITQNWGMGSTIGVILIVAMIVTMMITRERKNLRGQSSSSKIGKANPRSKDGSKTDEANRRKTRNEVETHALCAFQRSDAVLRRRIEVAKQHKAKSCFNEVELNPRSKDSFKIDEANRRKTSSGQSSLVTQLGRSSSFKIDKVNRRKERKS